ncbi:MAG TPA: T9SS type A sorting domain-containing protein, partial [Chitinophagaceae bacterium]|nr:T9SS type A sorting domain-containing protein [Chitinophagaceae bacterium]
LPLDEHYVPNRPVNNRSYVRLFPNPASDVLYIQSKRGMHKPLRAELYDIAGRRRRSMVSADDNFSFPVTGMEQGVYIFKLYNGYGVLMTTEKIIIK